MKRFIKYLCLILSILIIQSGHAQMRKIYLDTFSTYNTIKKISFYSGSQGYIASTAGGGDWIGYTTDSGRTFAKKYITLSNVDFGNYNVNITFGFAIRGVKAFNQNTVIAYGDYGLVPSILYSNNGGNSFTLVFHSQFNPMQLAGSINDMVFPENGSIGYAVDNDRILKTTNQGLTWSSVHTDPGAIFTYLEAVDNNTVFAECPEYQSSKLLKTLNGGASWQQVALPAIPSSTMNYATFLTATTGWVNMYDNNHKSYLHKTTDGGSNWTQLNDEDATPFSGFRLKFFDTQTGYALANEQNTVYKTLNGGVLWEPLERDNNYAYFGFSHEALQCFNINQLWAGGNKDFLEMSANGGGTPLPKAYFKIDSTGYYATGNIKLLNFSNPAYQFKWYVNNVLKATTYNYTYTHNPLLSLDSVKLVVTNNGKSDSLTRYQYFYVAPPPLPYTGWSLKPTNINDNLKDVRFFGNKGMLVGNGGIYYTGSGADLPSGWKKFIILNNPADSALLARTKFLQLAGNDKSALFFAIGNDTVNNKAILFRLNLADTSYEFVYQGSAGSQFNSVTINNVSVGNPGILQIGGDNGLFVSYTLSNGSINVSTISGIGNISSVFLKTSSNVIVNLLSGSNMYSGNATMGFTLANSYAIGHAVTQGMCSNIGSYDILYGNQKIYVPYTVGSTLVSVDSIFKFKPSGVQPTAVATAMYGSKIYIATNQGIFLVYPANSYTPYSQVAEYQPTSLQKPINNIWFKQQSQFDTGYAVGPNGTLLKTENFGGPAVPYAEINGAPGACLNENYTLDGFHGTGTICKWYLDNAFLGNSCNPSLTNMTVAGTHTLKYIVSNVYGMSDTAYKTIYVSPAPVINLPFAISDSILCKAEQVQVQIQNTQTGYRYDLIEQSSGANFGSVNGNGGTVLLFSTVISKTGYYYLRATGTSSGCSRNFTNKVYILVEKTRSVFTADNVNAATGEKINFYNQSITAQSFAWTFHQDANISSSTSASPQNISYPSAGQKTATLVSTSINGCRDTLTQNVIYIFSKPNPGDNCFANNVDDSDYAYVYTSTPTISGPRAGADNSFYFGGHSNRPLIKSRYGLNKKIAGTMAGYFVKYSEDGVVKWVDYIDTLGTITGSTADAEKNIYIIGYCAINSYFHFNTGDSLRISRASMDTDYYNKTQGFLLKVDSTGRYLWHAIFRDGSTTNTGYPPQGGMPVKVITKNNQVVVTGSFMVNLCYFKGGVSTDLYALQNTPAPVPFRNEFILGLSKDGALKWRNYVHNSVVNSYGPQDIELDNSGNVFYVSDYEYNVKLYDADSVLQADITGETGRNRSILFKVDSSGHKQWLVNLKSRFQYGSIRCNRLAVDNSGNAYITGSNFTFGMAEGIDITNPDNSVTVSDTINGFVLLKFNPTGLYKWGVGSRYPYYGYGQGLTISGANVYAVGQISNNSEPFATFRLTSTNGSNNSFVFYKTEFFIAHYDTAGVFIRIGKSGQNTNSYLTPQNITLDNSNNFIVTGVSDIYSGGNYNNILFGIPLSSNGMDGYYVKLNPNFCYTVVPPVAFAGNDTLVCPGQPVTLGSPQVAGNTYSWTSSPMGFTSSSAMPVVNPAVTTTYFLAVMNGNGNYGFDTVKVSIKPAPYANAGNDTSVCAGSSIQIGSPAITGNSYSWTSSPAGFTSLSAMPAINPAATTSYYLEVTAVNGCVISRDTVRVTVNPITSPSVTIVANTTNTCAGGTVTFTATPLNGGVNPVYQWKVNGVNTGPNSPVFTTTALNNGDQVQVIVTSNANCISTTTATSNTIAITVSSSVAPSVSISASATSFCSGSSITFTAIPVSGGSTPSYQWQVNGVNAGPNSALFTSNTLSNNDQVKVIMTSSLGCAVPAAATSNPITVTVTPSLTPAVYITASAISVCQGGNVNFTATPTNGGSSPSYQWKVNGINAGSNNPVFSTNSLTNGSQVSVIITSNASCLTSPQANSNTIAITVNPIVTPGVNISASTTNTCGNNQVTFTATATNGGSSPVYQWYVNNQPAGSNSASFTSTILANNDQVYVKLTSNASCLSTAVVSSNTITMSSSPSIFQTGSATVTNNLVCMNFAYQVNFVPLNTSMNSTIQLWQNTNNGAYGLHSTKIYSGSTLAFAVSPSAGPMVHRYYFRMLPPAAAICVLPANTDTTTVVVLNTIQPVIAQNNSGELYVTNPNSAGTYTWQQMGNPGAWVNLSPLVTGTLYALTSNGWYRVAQNNGACVLFSNAINVNSFRTDNGRGIHIYPNPGVEIVTIDSLLLLDKWTSMDIISPDGRSLNQHYDLANRTAITVSVSGLPAGVYSFLFRKENGDIVSRKFLKQ